MIKRNDGKTEIICFSSRYKSICDQAAVTDVRIGGVRVTPSSKVKNLGVIFDSDGFLDGHIASVFAGAAHSLWRIGKIRNLLDRSLTEKLVHAFVSSKLDYCNSLFFGITDKQYRKLEIIQNSGARLVTRMSFNSREHMTPVFR